jgi:hypothetical protein
LSVAASPIPNLTFDSLNFEITMDP